MVYSLLIWIALGAIIGAIANKFVDLRGDTPIFGIGAAVAGAFVLGLIHRLMTGNVELLNVLGLIMVAIGAAAGAATYHKIRSRSISRDRQTVRSSY